MHLTRPSKYGELLQAGYDFAVPGGCRFQTISVDAVPGMPGASSTVRLRTARIDRIG